MTDFEQTLGTGTLLAIAAAAVTLLLLLIITLRVHAFIALVLVSLLTALAAGVPAATLVSLLTGSFGTTLGSVALLIGLGAMLGRLLEASGGAAVLANAFIARFGERHAVLALGIASLLVGFPIFFDAGLIVMLPVMFSVARRLGGGLLKFGIPVAAAFAVMHVFVPPHPGPVAAAELLQADVGQLVLLGTLVAVPTWLLVGGLFGRWIGKRIVLPVPDILAGGPQEPAPANPPGAGTVMALLLLPPLLIFVNTGLDFARAQGWVDDAGTWFQAGRLVGATPVALLISVLIAACVLALRRGGSFGGVERTLESALGPVCSIILITGAGGMFGGVLRATGIGAALSDALADIGMPVFVTGFVIATALRVAQGSATVALITAAGLIQPAVQAQSYGNGELAAVVLAMAAGSAMLSHVNDSGFWLVGRFFGMDVRTTLKTWTVMMTLIGLIGFALAALLFWYS
jgi:GntP family gluconate:H+ symporter